MSGGKDRKRASRTQGWEEAGGEFYQESYPGELEVLQKDPSHLATLLPSKQNRAATTRRPRGDKNTATSTRRRGSTSTRRRNSLHNDVQVAMLPDLSENLTDEERTWEEIREIKAMPVSMSQKKELKAQLQSAEKLRLQGFHQIKWKQRKFWQEMNSRWKETYAKLELWRNSLKKIEGNFGTGVVAYFIFIKWLMFLNFFIFLLMFLFVVLPTILLESPITESCEYQDNNSTECCSEAYQNLSLTGTNEFLNVIQGTGFMEKTLIFYGFYTNQIYGFQPPLFNITDSESDGLYYDLPLAYVTVTVLYFLLSLVAIVKSAARGFKERLIEGEGQFYQYCNLVFGGWDFCIHNEKSATIKHKALFNEMQASLQAERLEEERHGRSREEKSKLIVVRCLINFIIIGILFGAGTIIFFVFNFSYTRIDYSGSILKDDLTTSLKSVFYEFLPSFSIVLLNLFVPILFKYLVGFEKYSPLFVVRISLLRTVFLRLSSLAVLLSRFYFLIVEDIEDGKCHSQQTPKCWETFVGQQFYKLVITDFAINIFVTFFINFPRSLIAKSIDNKFAKLVGEQEFELPRHVLDVVYSQTLCWLGSFYAPFLPAIATVVCFFMFYIKKFACLVNSTPSALIYRASRSNSLFMVVLLLSFVVSMVPVAYAIAEIMPSRSCGPFRGLPSVWDAAINAFMKLPNYIQNIIFYFGTAGFGVPAFIILTLMLYYYSAVSQANKHMVTVLKKQLVLEGHDKQFLLNRLSSFIKQQQEYSKRLRHSEMERERERHSRDSNH